MGVFGGDGGAGELGVAEGFNGEARLAAGGSGLEVGGAGQLSDGGQAAVVVDGDVRAEELLDTFQIADQGEGTDASAAAADGDAGIGIRADDEDGLDGVLVEREEVAFVLEENCAFLSRLKGDGLVVAVVDGEGVVGLGLVEPAESLGGEEDVADLLVDGGDGDGAGLDGGQEVLLIHERARGHFDIEPAIGCGHAVVGGDPV